MAEYLLRKRMGPDSGWQIESAGLLAMNGARASAEAVQVMAEDESVDLAPHRSRILTPAMVTEADMLVCMTPAHKGQILRSFPEASEKTFVLTEFGPEKSSTGIRDPIGCSVHIYRNIKNEIDSALSDLILYMRELK